VQRVYYAGAEFLMTDAATEALLEFAAVIAGAAKSQRVDLPAMTDHGEPLTMRAIIGPASQIVALHAPSDVPDPDSSAFVRDLAARGKQYRDATAMIGDHDAPGWDDLV
jgi:hypothetical protein